MAITGLVSIVSELRVERTNLVTQLKHIDAALSVLGKLSGGSSYTKPRHTLSAAGRRNISLAQKARWAKRASIEQSISHSKTEADDVSCSSKEDRGVSACEVGEGEGSPEEGRVIVAAGRKSQS